jgi:Cys-rich four helix bundle protein (predicted Tat secretion target)
MTIDSISEETIMHRREFVATIGTAAAVLSASKAFGAPANSAPAESMHPAKYKALEDATNHCVSKGDACMRHCLGMLSMKDASMAGCTNAARFPLKAFQPVGTRSCAMSGQDG